MAYDKILCRSGMLPKWLVFPVKLGRAHSRAITRLTHSHTPWPPPLPPPLAERASLSMMADKCNSMDQLKQIHARMIVTSRTRDDTFAVSRLLNFCALSSSGSLDYALKLFLHTPIPNTFMWNTLIRAQANSSNPSQGLILYAEMQRRGVSPGNHTFPFVLKACSNAKIVKGCEQVHVHVLKYALESDLHVANGLVRAYSVCGELYDARKVFDKLPYRNLSIWTTMICGYAQNESADEAITLFHGMIADGLEPNEVVLSSVLSACAQAACLDLGEQIHLYIEEGRVEMNLILGTAMVNMYAKNGQLVKAKQCFNAMKERNIATWNAIICGLAAHGEAKEAIHFFTMLENEKLKPNEITFVGVLSACCHTGLLDYGKEVFYSMRRSYSIEPKIKHYSCMVDMLGRAGRILEAEELIRGMVCKADVTIWGALLNACKEYGDIEAGERVVKEILHLDPHNHAAHVVLSNMYADAERWEDVMRRRQGMKAVSLKISAGWSIVGNGDGLSFGVQRVYEGNGFEDKNTNRCK